MTEEANVAFDTWYQDRLDNPNTSGDPRLNGYFERKPVHVLKVAMIISAAKHHDLIITVEDLEQTWSLLESTEAKMPKVFAAVGKNVLAFDLMQIGEAIVAAGKAGITEKELMTRFVHNVRKEELTEILATLVTMRAVELKQGPPGMGLTVVSRNLV